MDDDTTLRALLEQVLADAGHDVLTAADGQEALAIATTIQGELALVVTDILMPEMDGLELASHLAQLDPPPPVLFISGFASATFRTMPGPMLEKPFRAGQLLDRVAQMLESPAGLSRQPPP